MANNKRNPILKWKNDISNPFIIVILSSMTLFTIGFLALTLMTMKTLSKYSVLDQSTWLFVFIIFILIQICVNSLILMLMFTILHKTTGAFPRIEAILDKIIEGNFSLRLGLRDGDNKQVESLVNKFNKVLDILDSKTKK